jgi:hypothetical protein
MAHMASKLGISPDRQWVVGADALLDNAIFDTDIPEMFTDY